jgi:DNA sulfur modification protein DndB
MSFISQFEIDQFKKKLTNDLSNLGKIYKAKKSPYQSLSVEHSLVDDMISDGWEIVNERKKMATKTKLRKPKSYSRLFEDEVWCQMYELGYRHLNYDEQCLLPFGSGAENTKQIDVIAIDGETIILIECKSAKQFKRAPSYKELFEGLPLKLDGFKKVLEQAFGRGLKVKYIFATRNLMLNVEDADFNRLFSTGSFYYNDNTYDYINSLIKSYKSVATYQFLGLLFKNEIINLNKIEVPAVEGDMGGKKYYMFSIEPKLLLKMSFIMHRTRANVEELPTYQRLLVSKRLSGITKFIDNGGYFPNSIILNFSPHKHEVQFEPSSKSADSSSRFGMLKIPNAYAIAYVIDGQHRLYGYANSEYKDTNTIPVVAFKNLSSHEQLQTFMDINQNQKAVSPSLKLDLEEDLYWNDPKAGYRMQALRSSIVKGISNAQDSSLFNKITIGEDGALLSMLAFTNAINKSGLIPTANGNKYTNVDNVGMIYDLSNHDHDGEMKRSKKSVSQFLILCYNYVYDNYQSIFERKQSFIVSARGTYAFIVLIGLLNTYLSEKIGLTFKTTPQDRFNAIRDYLKVLLEGLSNITPDVEKKQLSFLGTGADTRWLRFFQTIINSKYPDYEPPELIDWKERQDEQLQDEGRKYGVAIEKHIKRLVLQKIKYLYKENWELEINSIKRECLKRAEEENEKNYKEGLKKDAVQWTEMFNINDYKQIIEKYWATLPQTDTEKFGFIPFQQDFSIDVGHGFHSKSDRIKWLSHFNSLRNQWAHEGTKEKGLNKEEVSFLQRIYEHFDSL